VPPLLAQTVDAEFTFAFASNSPLEPDNAIADVRAGSAEIWSSLKVPITAQEEIAAMLGLPQSAVKVHVVQGGGSFGRHLFHDVALEAAEASKKMGKPVKLSWSRTTISGRAGPPDVHIPGAREHPAGQRRHVRTAAHQRADRFQPRPRRDDHRDRRQPADRGQSHLRRVDLRAVPVVALQLRRHNTTAQRGAAAVQHREYAQHLLPNVVCAQELVVDQIANRMHLDPVVFRRQYLKNSRLLAVLNKAAQVGNWGAKLPAGIAQGVGVHAEYQAAIACLVEIDCTPATVNRQIPNAVTGPRVTKAVIVVDPGFAINPRGLEAQMIGGMNDAIALALTSSLHMQHGIPLEGSWDNYFYTRQWNTPLDMQVVIMPNTSTSPSGAGELAVAPSFAAIACAYARATGKLPTSFPINHGTLSFTPYPLEPSTPQSPTDGLVNTF